MGEHRRGAAEPRRRRAPHDLARDGREELHAERRGRRRSCVRPRGWHLEERHHTVDGSPISASLFDFGLAFFHNARELLERGSGPYFYLPKLESHEEARLWAQAFALAEETLGIPRGSIRCTVLIETITGRVRDGRDPLRAARLRLRAQRRPLGLHLQHDQEARRGAARPRCR